MHHAWPSGGGKTRVLDSGQEFVGGTDDIPKAGPSVRGGEEMAGNGVWELMARPGDTDAQPLFLLEIVHEGLFLPSALSPLTLRDRLEWEQGGHLLNQSLGKPGLQEPPPPPTIKGLQEGQDAEPTRPGLQAPSQCHEPGYVNNHIFQTL